MERVMRLTNGSEARKHYIYRTPVYSERHFCQLGKETFLDTVSKIHSLAAQDLPKGFRIILNQGENSRESSTTIHLIGGEPLVSPFIQDCKDGARTSPSKVEEKPKEKCVMCKFADGRIQLKPEEIVADDASFLVINPLSRNAAIHNVLFPKKPYRDFIEAGSDLEFWGRAYDYFCQREQEDLSDGFRLISNNRNWAGQQTQHLHIHILGGERLPSPFWQDWEINQQDANAITAEQLKRPVENLGTAKRGMIKGNEYEAVLTFEELPKATLEETGLYLPTNEIDDTVKWYKDEIEENKIDVFFIRDYYHPKVYSKGYFFMRYTDLAAWDIHGYWNENWKKAYIYIRPMNINNMQATDKP